MRLVFAGTPEVAIPSLDQIWESDHELLAVITRPPAPKGRSKTPVPSAVHQWALDHGVPVFTEHPKDLVAKLESLNPDAIPVVAYGNLVPQSALAVPRYGWLNLHFSLLPAYRGAAPVQRAIIAGETRTGATIFKLVSALDAGPIYRQIETTITDETTSANLLTELAQTGAKLLLEVLAGLDSGTIEAKPQDESLVTLAAKLEVPEGEIDWQQPANNLLRKIHGFNPAPGAYTYLAGQRFKVWEVALSTAGQLAELPAELAELAPGQLLFTKKQVFVGTGTIPLVLRQVQPLGKKAMAAADWGRGLREPVATFEITQTGN